jgi:hypothetical protein
MAKLELVDPHAAFDSLCEVCAFKGMFCAGEEVLSCDNFVEFDWEAAAADAGMSVEAFEAVVAS